MPTETLSHQVPINGTCQKQVPPGNQTNLYYILLSNLPWQASWQQLKDHVRSVCSVERVEVFPESTHGWVSVRGRDNYDAAFKLLDGGIFNGRALFADGRNATDSIMIKELVDSTGFSSSSQRSPRTPRRSTPPSIQSSASPPLLSPTGTEYSHWTTSAQTMPYVVSPVSPHHGAYGDMYGQYVYDVPSCHYVDQAPSMSVAMAQGPYDDGYGLQHYQVDDHQSNVYPWPSYYGSEHSNGKSWPGSVSTKKRKIIIKQLKPGASENQLHELIKQRMPNDASKLQYLNLPMAEGSGATRGYAIAIFETEEAAAKAVRKLNGCKHDGRILDVDITKEGVSEKETRPRHGREDRERREKKESSKSSGDKKSSSKSQSSKSVVVIANGSSSSSKDKKSSRKH